jgi:hypothetical protein
VAQDVRAGVVSTADARDIYKVVLDAKGDVDRERTALARQQGETKA